MQNDNLTRVEAGIRAGIVSNVRYHTSIVLTGEVTRNQQGEWTTMAPTFDSTTVARFVASQSSTFIDCDAADVRAVTLNGRAVDPAAIHDGRIELTGLATEPGQLNELTVAADMEYHTDGIGIHRHIDQTDGLVYLYSNAEPFDAHRWMACFDQSNIKAEWTLTVTAPADWAIVSCYPPAVNGESIEGATRTVTFEPTPPISTYLMAVCAGQYHEVKRETADGIACSFLVRRSLVDAFDVDDVFTTTENGLKLFPGLFGQPYPFKKYDQVFVPEFNAGAMENVGCVTHADQYYIFRSRATRADFSDRATTILHEMAHMWFGDLVTMDWWDDLWLNESFATFMAFYAKVATGEYPDAWVEFSNADKAWALRQDQLPSTHPIAADAPDVRQAQLNFDGITYAKGAAVLRQLVAYVGEDRFFDGLGHYFEKHAWKNATMADFLASLEQASGRNLIDWANRWLKTTGVSTLRPVIELSPGGTEYASVAIAQDPSPDGSLRPHRLVLGCYALQGGRLSRTDRIEIDVDGPLTVVPQLAGVAVPDLLLVNDEDLTFAKVTFDDRSLATLVGHLAKIEDPLARTICWADAWDMTRDAAMATRDWVSLVAGQATSEQEVGVLQRMLGRAELAINIYGDPSNRSAARGTLHATARDAMFDVAAGSDHQFIWARAYIDTADEPADLDGLRRWLAGDDLVTGIDLTADDAKQLRWAMVARLVAKGWIKEQAPETFIDAELQRDTADVWKRASLTALASRPTEAAKRDAWDQATGDGPLNLKERQALVHGFAQADQDALLAPYIERWAEIVPTVWRTKSHDLAETITAGLYPAMIVTDDVVMAANRVLDIDDLDPSARRVVMEALDGTHRARRAQLADVAAGRSDVVGAR